MKLAKKHLPALAFSLIASIPGQATAANGSSILLKMGTPKVFGPGCSTASTHFGFSPDSRSISVLFDAYQASASPNTGSATSYCQIKIPLEVAPGYMVTSVSSDYRGFNNLPDRGVSVFRAWQFIANSIVSPRTALPFPQHVYQTFVGPKTEDFTVSLKSNESVYSNCVSYTTLTFASDLTVVSNAKREPASIMVDSLDGTLKPQGKFKIYFKKCE